jgi:hypothetical protein
VGVWGKEALRRPTLYWLAGNLFQGMWCLAFRPSFKRALWLPAGLLAGGALSLFGAHKEITSLMRVAGSGDKVSLALLRFPLALHAAWLSAASLLNLNGWAAVEQISLEKQLALAHASAYTAALLGLMYTAHSHDPFVGE